MKDNDVLMQYRTMRETLIYLSHLDYEDTEHQMLEKLRGQMSGSWTWNGLNTLCWAIGSISGSMHVSAGLAGQDSCIYHCNSSVSHPCAMLYIITLCALEPMVRQCSSGDRLFGIAYATPDYRGSGSI
eukprot:GHRR01021621.1.p3 GENE.GHRR01021621.1~~GHRR01021621.1.p3  ORF type:complete len:128 (+),score=30.68 GHRR01021621.1:316-699(+)